MIDEAMRQAIQAIPETNYTSEGVPTVAAMMKALGHSKMTAAERDEIWQAYLAEPAQAATEFKLLAAPSNPLELRVNGRAIFSMRVGDTMEIEPDMLDRLHAVPGVKLQEVGA